MVIFLKTSVLRASERYRDFSGKKPVARVYNEGHGASSGFVISCLGRRAVLLFPACGLPMFVL